MATNEQSHSPTPEELMAYLDGEATLDSRHSIEAHLPSCVACRTLADQLRDVMTRAGAWKVESAPRSLRAPASPDVRSTRALFGTWRFSPMAMSFAGIGLVVIFVVSLMPYQLRSRMSAPHAPGAPSEETRTVNLSSAPARPQAQSGRELSRGGGGGGNRVSVGESAAIEPAQGVTPARQPMVIRTAVLRVIVRDFDPVRARIETIVSQAAGFIDQMTVSGDPGSARTLRGVLRVPGTRLADVLAALRPIGHAVEDTQGSEDVSDQVVDLDARLANARATEQRLTDILKNRTGKLSDVLEVEREVARVRLDIERMDAEKANIGRRVAYATITLEITEERKVSLESGPLPLTTRFWVAFAEGLESAIETIVGLGLFVLRAGPSLLIWLALAAPFWPLVRRFARKPSA